MKSEQELREWRLDLYKEYAEHADIPSMESTISASIDTLSWALDDTPAKDLERILALVVAKLGESDAHGWLTESLVDDGVTPLKVIAAGRADLLLSTIEQLEGVPHDQSNEPVPQ